MFDEYSTTVEQHELLDYTKAKIRIDALISSWSRYKTQATCARKDRYIDLDVEQLRQSGEISPDETLVPRRIIDENLIREKADAMAFLNSSHRLAYFRCVDDPNTDTRQLESEVTKGLTYKGWYKEFDRHFDGAGLHGWDAIEVVYDESKPLRVGFVHLGFDKVMFNSKIADIQNSPIVAVEMEVTVNTLEEFVTDFGFDSAQVDVILSKNTDKKKDDHVIKIYKIYFKINKCVYIAWYCKEEQTSNWLKAPEKFRCGILTKNVVLPQQSLSIGQAAMGTSASDITLPNINEPMQNSSTVAPPTPVPIETFTDAEVNLYPIFLYIYREDEQEAIADKKGRAFFDAPQQEAVTAVTTGYVNGILRASNVYASAKEDNGEGNSWLEEVELENGLIFKQPVEFFNTPYPDASVIQGLQYLSTTNAQSTGKMAVAVSNRKDSRKTAKELDLASGEEAKITSTGLANYSDWLRGLFAFSWLIIQSQALAGNITLLPKKVPQTTPAMGPIPPMPIGELTVNDVEVIGKTYDVRAAGDVDVIEKQQQLQAFQQDWPVFQTTALAQTMLEDYIRLRYPLKADQYIAILRAGNPAKQIVSSLLAVAQGAIQPEELKALDPQKQNELATVMQTAQQFLAQPV